MGRRIARRVWRVLAVRFVLTATSGSAADLPPDAKVLCGPDAVTAGTVCLDQYEASVWRVPAPSTATAGLVAKIQQGDACSRMEAGGATQLVRVATTMHRARTKALLPLLIEVGGNGLVSLKVAPLPEPARPALVIPGDFMVLGMARRRARTPVRRRRWLSGASSRAWDRECISMGWRSRPCAPLR
jgi:hypothetical protein